MSEFFLKISKNLFQHFFLSIFCFKNVVLKWHGTRFIWPKRFFRFLILMKDRRLLKSNIRKYPEGRQLSLSGSPPNFLLLPEMSFHHPGHFVLPFKFKSKQIAFVVIYVKAFLAQWYFLRIFSFHNYWFIWILSLFHWNYFCETV